MRKIKIYREYLKTRHKKGGVSEVAKKFGISRQAVHQIKDEIEKGNRIQLERCMKRKELDCKWEWIYQTRWLFIDEQQDQEALIALIKEMHKDGFGVREIARRINKPATSISYHLRK